MVPHVPQLLSSVLVLVQVPEQFWSPVMHTEPHTPETQAHCELGGRVPLHAEQPPPQQTPPVQLVPSVTLTVPPHVCVPVVQDVVPVWHVLPGGLHAIPAVQGTHEPPLQTSFVPHGVPSATLPVELQTDVPVEHEVWPVWQAFPLGKHAWPAVHAPQLPELSQTPPEHAVPGGAVPVWVHTGEPVVHEIDPRRQRLLLGLQAAPVAQATQLPPLQTMLVPHGVPLPTIPVDIQVCVPVEHDVVPVAHAFPPGAHATPAEQAAQLPPLQTMFVPHDVPSDA